MAVVGDRWGVLAILFVHMVLAIEGLLWRAARGSSSDVLVWLLAATSAWILAGTLDTTPGGADWLFTAPGQEYLWLGLPVVLGALVHDIGDALTVSGCPRPGPSRWAASAGTRWVRPSSCGSGRAVGWS
ncbi:hypothetical protein SFUMM280S_00450 [Streptomyces fumanus]